MRLHIFEVLSLHYCRQQTLSQKVVSCRRGGVDMRMKTLTIILRRMMTNVLPSEGSFEISRRMYFCKRHVSLGGEQSAGGEGKQVLRLTPRQEWVYDRVAKLDQE